VTATQLQKLPLGLSLSDLPSLRKIGCVYVDKTEYAYKLITQEQYRYFLSRPRRFGKSLFVSTLEEILRSNKELFKGLWIAQSDYTWQEHGVIKLDLSKIEAITADNLRTGICRLLNAIATTYKLDIEVDAHKIDAALDSVALALHARFGRVALLIDEYDSPILKSLHDHEHARNIRQTLHGFFTNIKRLGASINFIFITGVSSFAKAGLFSGMNNLKVITLQKQYAALCGYTDEELDQYFSTHMQAWSTDKNIPYAELRAKIKRWYNGYHFGADTPSVYNPFSVMNAFDDQAFKNYWFESGRSHFLIEELTKEYRKKDYSIFEAEHFKIFEDSLGSFDIGTTPVETLMFQTGYLTITGYDENSAIYTLGYPNFEVKTALQRRLLGIVSELDPVSTNKISLKLIEAFEQKNIEEIVSLLKQLFVKVPYQLHTNSEKFYHALLQMLFDALGLRPISEHSISHGRLDMVLEIPACIYIIEFKLNKPASNALAQIKDLKYYEAFLSRKKPILLLGLAFQRTAKKFDITAASEIISNITS
jgi:hypothetical protein